MRRGSERCISCQPQHQTGAGNPNWKEGVTYHKKGYVMRRVADHPRASNGYVLDHILVMEEKLGRFLLPEENVHHKNGVRSDNHPNNLELWRKPQPSGARVSDLIEWAESLLQQYAPDKLK
jgi:hypothetical protein